MEINMITDILEALTIFCFGLSWPISIRKSIISRHREGQKPILRGVPADRLCLRYRPENHSGG